MTELSVAIPLAILCVLVAGFCSGTEVALFSLRRVDREQLTRSDSRRDRRIVALLERPRRLIATVLIGNEACAAVLVVIALGLVERYTQIASPWLVALVALAITLPVFVLIAEVTAKTLAAKAPLAWARSSSGLLTLMTLVVTPVRVVVNVLAELMLRPLGQSARTRPARDLSEQEFKSLVDAGSARGEVDARERRLIHRVFEFSDKNVGQVMTPRDRIFGLSYDLPTRTLVKELAARGFSRVPIYQKSLDNVRGILNAKDLVRAAAGGTAQKPLNELLHEPLFVPRTTPVKRLFLTFKQKKVHMAIVVSEYGKVLGLVTMDDLLSQIFGVIRDERADLQASMPGIKVPRAKPAPHVDTGPVAKQDLDSGPVPKLDPSLDSGPAGRFDTNPGSDPRPDSEPGDGTPRRATSEVSGVVAQPIEGLDPPVRPIHPTDEVTPPAVDMDDLARMRERKG
ncbi:MAG TPA: hemolysin family protein [Kofleriaceae bacterium]|nr:hemolysin family protein [Kofleriaceae bacterium]